MLLTLLITLLTSLLSSLLTLTAFGQYPKSFLRQTLYSQGFSQLQTENCPLKTIQLITLSNQNR